MNADKLWGKMWFVVTAAVIASLIPFGGKTPDVLAVSSTQTITEDDIARQPEGTPPTNNWVLYTRVGTASGVFVLGPENPPLGAGSLELSTPLSTDKVYLFNYDHVGTPLVDIDAISYETYISTPATFEPRQVTSLNIQVDSNGPAPGGFTTLVFEPVYNPDQGAVVPGEWQDWDAYLGGNAIWWSTQPIVGCLVPYCYMTWNYIVTNNPDATILGGFGVNQGSGNPGLVAAVDALTLGYLGDTVIYNFEVLRREHCKNGGWQTMTRNDGSRFRNQGDCIQYVNTGR